MESQCLFVAAPDIYIRVILPSSMHTVNSHLAFAMTINTKAKDNLSSILGFPCVHLSSHMANFMLHSQRSLLNIRSIFYLRKGEQGPRLRM